MYFERHVDITLRTLLWHFRTCKEKKDARQSVLGKLSTADRTKANIWMHVFLCTVCVVVVLCSSIIYRLQVSKTPESMEDLAGLSEAVYREYVGTTGNYLLGRAYIMPPSTPVSSQLLFEFPCSFPVDSPLFG